MRIISGKRRGLHLTKVGQGDAAAHLRPTTDRVRENIFNLLTGGAYGDPITDARVLDLFAGTGALGLEAWSRGAAHVTFVDDGSKAQSLIRQNIDLCRADEDTQLLRKNATQLGDCKTQPFNLAFLDPPYRENTWGKGTVVLRGRKLAGHRRTGGLGRSGISITTARVSAFGPTAVMVKPT